MKYYFKATTNIGERLLSFFIDYGIFTLVSITALVCFLISSSDQGRITGIIVFSLLVPPILSLKDIAGGRSLGKRALSLGVRDQENPNTIPSKFRLVLRNLTLIFWPVEIFTLLLNPSKQRLGEILTKTIVVKLQKMETEELEALERYNIEKRNTKALSKRTAAIIVVITSFIFVAGIFMSIGVVAGVGNFMKNNGAYKTTISQIENNKVIASEIGEIKGYGFMPMGTISISNGYGEAELTISVKGEKKNIKVFSRLYKEPNSEWQIVEFEIVN